MQFELIFSSIYHNPDKSTKVNNINEWIIYVCVYNASKMHALNA